jgi:hypothetical protein
MANQSQSSDDPLLGAHTSSGAEAGKTEKPGKSSHTFPRFAENLISDFLSVPADDSHSRRPPTKDVNELLEQILNKYQIGRDAPEHTIRENWKAIAGSNAHYSHPVSIDARGRLLVLVSHAIVRNELFMHRALIVQKIQKLPGCSGVREIQVKTG